MNFNSDKFPPTGLFFQTLTELEVGVYGVDEFNQDSIRDIVNPAIYVQVGSLVPGILYRGGIADVGHLFDDIEFT